MDDGKTAGEQIALSLRAGDSVTVFVGDEFVHATREFPTGRLDIASQLAVEKLTLERFRDGKSIDTRQVSGHVERM